MLIICFPIRAKSPGASGSAPPEGEDAGDAGDDGDLGPLVLPSLTMAEVGLNAGKGGNW